ncbi:AraC family transcriptional regulator [Eubacterium sp. MSJ-13]|uniref:AraC family transcriptional regulator n=1 Tax=Eubacterium sp. MSJ-13 TaxID=2841513 RepID=UPI001C128402|nr:AraC family transcriptional regulator [Eubacterium sp. MSJ-13]MBU5478170.1 AraC family transcriptional regulator [Eubacterium sp. MSJ-13]
MAAKKKKKIEFRYYKMPAGISFLALLGEKWVRSYGHGIDYLHFHNCMEIGYCYEGEGTLSIGEKDYSYRGGQFSIIPKNCPHTTTSSDGTVSRWEYLFVDVDEILNCMYPAGINKKSIEQMILRINAKAMFCDAREYPDMAERILHIFDVVRRADEYYIEEAKALINEFLVRVARANVHAVQRGMHENKVEKTSMFISDAISYISDHYMEPIRIENLAAQCHISETHFRRLFSNYMSIGPLEYINLVRIQNACEMLKKTDEMVSDIAYKCGFGVLSTFNRNFKQVMGCSPYEWRKKPENFEQQILKAQVRSEEGW